MDALEEELLFPKEYLGEENYIATGESTNRLEKSDKAGQMGQMRFALNLEIDKEREDEDEEYIALEPSKGGFAQGDDGPKFALCGRGLFIVENHEGLINSE